VAGLLGRQPIAQFLKHGKSYAFGTAFVAPQPFGDVLEECLLIHRISLRLGP